MYCLELTLALQIMHPNVTAKSVLEHWSQAKGSLVGKINFRAGEICSGYLQIFISNQGAQQLTGDEGMMSAQVVSCSVFEMPKQ